MAASGDLKLREVTSHGTITQLAGGRAALAPGSDSAELTSGQCGLCYFLATQKVSFTVAAALPLLRRNWRRLFFILSALKSLKITIPDEDWVTPNTRDCLHKPGSSLNPPNKEIRKQFLTRN